jgi:hypothetical protein
MITTFGQILQIVAPYIGKSGIGECSFTDPIARLKVATLIQEYVQRSGTLRKWCLYSRDNIITLPRDLALILKVKINGAVEPVHSKWYEYYDTMNPSEFDCPNEWQSGVIQEVNNFPTVYNLSHHGAHVLAEIGKGCKSVDGAYTIIQGISADTGEDVYTTYKGETIHGERLDLEAMTAKRTRTRFKTITNITKTETNDYVKYYQQVDKSQTPTVLSMLAPKEIIGEFRRAKILTTKCNPSQCYKLSVLGRVQIRSDYHDNDIVPITDINSLLSLAQAQQSTLNNNLQAAGFKYQLLDRQIEDEQMYNRVSDNSLDINFESSPGSIDELL